MFSWKTGTIERLAEHIATVSRQHTMAAITYYRRKGDVETVQRIKFARELAKKYRVILLAEEIKKQIEEIINDEKSKSVKEDPV